MKKTSRIFSVMLALALVFAMTIPAFAADQTWTGSITINSSDNVSVNGKVFRAYKILDAEAVDTTDLSKGVLYTIPAALQNFYNTTCGKTPATVADIEAYLKADDADLQAFAVAALAAAKTANVEVKEATGADNKATFKGLAFGYYVIEDTANSVPVSALMLRTSSVDVTIKADKTGIKKNIDGDKDEDNTTSGLVDYNTAAVGDVVPYVLTSKVPVMTGYKTYTYTVTDEFSKGLTYNGDSLVVTVGGTVLTKGEHYTAVVEGQKVTIDFIDFVKRTAGQEIKITYTATVNDNAVMGVEGNPNAVTLTYSNNPQDNTKFTTEKDETRTYLVNLVVNKVDDKGGALAGAQFALKQGSETLATGDSDANGKVVFAWTGEKGLKDGETYIITETDAPAGYSEAKDIEFKVTCKDPENGTDCKWSSSNNEVTFVVENNDFEATVVNLTGSVLPETGGIGTTIFYVVGFALMFGAAVLLITKKRMSCEA